MRRLLNNLKRGKKAVRQKYRLVLVFQTIGRGGDVSFLDQSQRVVQQNVCNPRILLLLDWS